MEVPEQTNGSNPTATAQAQNEPARFVEWLLNALEGWSSGRRCCLRLRIGTRLSIPHSTSWQMDVHVDSRGQSLSNREYSNGLFPVLDPFYHPAAVVHELHPTAIASFGFWLHHPAKRNRETHRVEHLGQINLSRGLREGNATSKSRSRKLDCSWTRFRELIPEGEFRCRRCRIPPVDKDQPYRAVEVLGMVEEER